MTLFQVASVLLIAGVIAGLIQYFVDFKGLPIPRFFHRKRLVRRDGRGFLDATAQFPPSPLAAGGLPGDRHRRRVARAGTIRTRHIKRNRRAV